MDHEAYKLINSGERKCEKLVSCMGTRGEIWPGNDTKAAFILLDLTTPSHLMIPGKKSPC